MSRTGMNNDCTAKDNGCTAMNARHTASDASKTVSECEKTDAFYFTIYTGCGGGTICILLYDNVGDSPSPPAFALSGFVLMFNSNVVILFQSTAIPF